MESMVSSTCKAEKAVLTPGGVNMHAWSQEVKMQKSPAYGQMASYRVLFGIDPILMAGVWCIYYQ